MAVTKTNFINYVRCPRYVALDNLKKDKLESDVTLSEYRAEEQEQYLIEILGEMYDENDEDLIDEKNEHLEIMLPYYNQVEILAGKLAPKYFSGNFKYSQTTHNQESFDAVINGIRYLCYVDIYNEVDDHFNIIEVKATTSGTFLKVGKSSKDEFDDKEVISIFKKSSDGIYRLLEEEDNIEDYMPINDYYKHRAKLLKRLDKAGHYVYDLAVQRYIIENDLKQNGMEYKIPEIKYYLATLNSEYVYDGKQENGINKYDVDLNGNNIVSFFDMTNLTKDYMDIIDIDRRKVEEYIKQLKIDYVHIGDHCEKKRTTECKYTKVCWNHIPKYNSILNYIGNHHGFKDESGNKYNRYDLIKDGRLNMLDVPENLLNRYNNIVQRRVVATGNPFMNIDKIKAGLSQIKYPIYHLDFETFPCPIPRFAGEKCYSQSVFQFSLHIEREPGLCDKNKDHYEYLAKDHNDNREELIKKMIEYIDINSGGTILVYNESFEKTRLKELGEIFPQYKKELNKMRDMIFDLLYVVKTKSSLYEELGFNEEDSKMFNYYHKNMNGSFSIKKVLPLFSNLSYDNMEVGNGMDAIVAYASFPTLTKEQVEAKRKLLIEYCKQDTWAMVEVLHGLINTVKYSKQDELEMVGTLNKSINTVK